MHPYEMYQLLTARQEDRLVKVRPGSLYHTVARLADQELVSAEGVDREGRRPERTTYRITGSGRKALRHRITEVLRAPAREFPVFPLALAEAHNLPKEQVLVLLRERVANQERDLADVVAATEFAGTRAVPQRYWIELPYLQSQLRAEIDWLRGFISDLESDALPWDNFDPVSGARIAGEAPSCRSEPEPWPSSARPQTGQNP